MVFSYKMDVKTLYSIVKTIPAIRICARPILIARTNLITAKNIMQLMINKIM